MLNFLTSPLGKYLVIGLSFFAVIVFYNLKVNSLENTISSLNISVKELTLENDDLVTTNNKNKQSIDMYKQDVEKMKEASLIIYKNKDNEILQLKKIISDFRKPVIYEKEVVYKDCKLKIKTDDLDENSTLNVISRIGF